MEALSYDEIFILIKSKQMLRACYYLEKNLFRDCYGFIVDKTRTMSSVSRKEIFDEAFTDFCVSVVSGKFVYSGVTALRNYFIGACQIQINNRIKQMIKKQRYEMYLSEIMHGISEEVFTREFDTVVKEIQEEQKSKYKLDIVLDDEEDDFYEKMNNVNQIIKGLNEQCQKIIYLRFFLHIPHKEIPNYIPNLTTERSPITTLSRCLHQIRVQLLIKKLHGTEK